MKTLLITRHAKTVPGSGQLRDYDRYLSPRGPKDLKLVAQELIDLEYEVDFIISSPAKRAMETAEYMAKYLNYPVSQIKYLEYLYGYFTTEQLLADITRIAAKARSVMLVGHNPSMADLGSDLTLSFSDHLPTSGTLAIDFDVAKWDYVSPGSGILTQFIFPSGLRE